MNKYPPTPEQSRIIDAAKSNNSIVVAARAGCAKTDTGVRLAEAYPNRRWQFIVFNKANAEEFGKKLPNNANGSTAHSFCNKFIKKRKGFKLDTSGYKVFNIVFRDPDYNFKLDSLSKEESMSVRENLNSMKELIGLLKVYFVAPKPEDVLFVMNHYGIGFNLTPDQVCSDAVRFLQESDQDSNYIDFNDMIRFPVIANAVYPSFDYFFLDEAQDNTPIRNLLLSQMRERGCNVIAVGDEFQAIYGFAGASCDSMRQIEESIKPIVLPLTTNFRCGKRIIEEAQKIVPDIMAWDKSPDGEVCYANNESFLREFENGDVALSRFNKIIIPACFKLIKAGHKATIQGKDFGKMLKGMVSDFKATTMDEFYERIDKWQERQLKNCKSDSATDAINDRHECLVFFADNSDTVDGILSRIDTIFSDEQGEGMKLSTVHKAKGMEWNKVYILDSNNFMQSHPNDKPWNVQQLRNLMYVAETRAKQRLTYVN